MAVTRTSWTPGNGPATKFKPGQSGNPTGGSKAVTDIIEAARALTPRALAALDKALDDPARAVQAAQVLLDRAWGRPPIFADLVTHEPVADVVWGPPAKGPAAATIDATAASGDTEEGDGPIVVWGDGTRAA
jgi:hypothetical protein